MCIVFISKTVGKLFGETMDVAFLFDVDVWLYENGLWLAMMVDESPSKVGVPAREVGSPCWNTGIFAGAGATELTWLGGFLADMARGWGKN